MAEGVGGGELLKRLGEVSSRLDALEARVASLEHGSASRRAAPPAAVPEDETLAAPELPAGTLALVGRTLLVLAGAYVIRALSDGHTLPAAVGMATRHRVRRVLAAARRPRGAGGAHARAPPSTTSRAA